jgi:molybdopterin-guanine dinucleotide biosynthesis protein A
MPPDCQPLSGSPKAPAGARLRDVGEPAAAELGGIVLTGGSAVRFEGADKASIEIAGATLLEHVLGALAEVPDVVVVGDEVITSRPVGFVREDPPGGGPAAGLLAGLAGFPLLPRLVVVLAVDMPFVTIATIRRLMLSAEEDGALLVDDGGRHQYLCAIYRSDALLAAAPTLEEQHGLPMRSLVSSLRLAEVPALAWEARDVDTWDDLAELREHLGG